MTYGNNKNISASLNFDGSNIEVELAREMRREIDKAIVDDLIKMSRDLLLNENINNALNTNFNGLKAVDAGLFCKKRH